jgi:hypothetical protein
MKRHIANFLFGLGLCHAALGGPVSIYENNYGVVTTPPVVDATIFLNEGDFIVTTIASLTNNNAANSFYGYGFNANPFMTKDTLYFTNTSSGFMEGEPGFQFDTATSKSMHSASFFLNQGTVEGVDTEALPIIYAPGASAATAFVPIPADSQPIPSQVIVLSTNIVNTGTMAVGNVGLLRLTGNNVTNNYATLVAGSVNTAGIPYDPADTTGLQGEEEWEAAGGQYFYVPSPDVYDLFWGVSNTLANFPLDEFDPPDTFGVAVGVRGFYGFDSFEIPLPVNLNAQWSVTAYYFSTSPTNSYYNIVFVNTNFADTNLSATVGFTEGFFPQDILTPTTDDGNALEVDVQFAEPVTDVITGQTVTNGIYLIDDGAILPATVLDVNAGNPDDFTRPNAFELTTVTPPQWPETVPGNYFYDPNLIYAGGMFANKDVPYVVAQYGAQIGHNPADIAGSFASLADTNSILVDELLGLDLVNLVDPTNEAGRIEINAGNLDMTQTRIRAEGMVILNATNLTGGPIAAEDWGEANAAIGATNGSLIVSNLFPTSFHRVRGDIYAWAVNWVNLETNNNFGNTNNPVTNNIHYHVLVVDQNLFGTFPSTLRSLTLTGKKSVVLQDNLNVIGQAVINATNLTINGTNYFSQNAENFTPATTPTLKNLFVNTNAFLGAYSTLDIGYNVNEGQGTPTGRRYTVNTITNFGQMSSTAPLFESAVFENDGLISSDNGGSIVIEANTLGLGLALTNATNFILAAGNIDLSAASIEATNSIISAGLGESGSLTLYATEQLTDFLPGTPTTNTNSVIFNHWTVTGGFNMPVKPATGDLFGTEIHTISTNFEQVTHVWAGTDMGATPAGFVNNTVIGRLVLDRQSSDSVLRFSAAGAANAMYVDYLQLTNFAYTNYRTGLIIDPNFTIYFADSNADPEKLMEIYPRLIWVQNFAGPNSTQVVPYLDSSNICLMNAALAQSTEISFFNGVANFYNQPFVLNNPSDPTETYPCPGDETTLRSMLVSTATEGGGKTLNLLNISVNGKGSITPELTASQMALGKSYTLKATPGKGWVFQNWSTIGLPGAVDASSPVLPFNFVSNTLITANFVPNPFTVLQGVYNGLFSEAGAVNPGSSGAFNLTLAPSGSFSGRLLMGPSAFSFSSKFSAAGGAQVPVGSGPHLMTLNLQLDITGETGQILGDVNGGAWDAALVANIAPTWTSTSPSPLAGNYTMVLPWNAGGDSYGAGAVSKLGVLTIAGTLADGATFTQSAPVSQDGQWPFYVYAAVGKDSILGWVSVSNGLSATNVTWSKAAGKGPLYGAGFTNSFQLTGSPWLAPARKEPALSLHSPAVMISGGGLPESLTIDTALENYLTYAATNLSLSINAASGKFSGWFDNPDTGKRNTISGVVLQNAGSACGFFQGTNESGAVLLQGQ